MIGSSDSERDDTDEEDDRSDEEDKAPNLAQQIQEITAQITQVKNTLMSDLRVVAEVRRERLKLQTDHPYFKSDEFKNNIRANTADHLTVVALTALFSFDQNLLNNFLQGLQGNVLNAIFGPNSIQNILNAYHQNDEENLQISTAFLYHLPSPIKEAVWGFAPHFINSLNVVLNNIIIVSSENLINKDNPNQNDTEHFGRTIEEKAKKFSAGGDDLIRLINSHGNQRVKIAYALSLILRTGALTEEKKLSLKLFFLPSSTKIF